MRLGFLLLNLLSGLGSAWLLYRLLRHYSVSLPLILLAVAGWAVLPMGLRWAMYYPVLPDTLGFFLLLALIVAALEGRFLLFGGLLIAGTLTRENLIALGPFIWFIHVRRGPVGVTLRSLAVGLAAVAVYFAVRVFPVIPSAPGYENWAERYNISINLGQVFWNYDAHAWRYALAALLSLGTFFALPFAWPRRALAFLGREGSLDVLPRHDLLRRAGRRPRRRPLPLRARPSFSRSSSSRSLPRRYGNRGGGSARSASRMSWPSASCGLSDRARPSSFSTSVGDARRSVGRAHDPLRDPCDRRRRGRAR